MNNTPTKESFLQDVKDHKLTVLHNDGLYRHLNFRGKDFTYWFEIITYPDGLVMRGDMGFWIFERTEDMFKFFRHPNGELEINTGYWAEKCKSQSVFGNGIREFNPDGFRERVKNYWEEYFDEKTDTEEAKEVWESIEDQILSGEDAEWDLVSRLNYFDCEGFEFTDFWENTVMKKTYHFVWACYAIAWAVRVWDEWAISDGQWVEGKKS